MLLPQEPISIGCVPVHIIGCNALSALYKLITRTPTTEGIIYQSPRTQELKHNGRVEMHSLINIADEVSSHLKTDNLKMGHRSSTVTELSNKQECDK